MPLFKVYGKDLRIEPREVGELLLDMGQEFIAVGGYPVPIPPISDVVRELPPAFDVLPPLVVIPRRLGVVVVDHHPQRPVFHLASFKEAVEGFLFRLVELEDDLVKQVRPIASGYPFGSLKQVGVVPLEVSVQRHSPQCPESHPHSSKSISACGRCF